MGRIICIGSQKGGVGKTTTAIGLSAAFAIAEKRVLLVDSDPQGHATDGLGLRKIGNNFNLYHGLKDNISLSEITDETPVGLIKLIPSGNELMRVESELSARHGKEAILRNLLQEVRDQYDYIIIDCPPNFNLLTLNALAASDSFLIPLQCEYYAFKGLGKLLKTYKIVKEKFNPGMSIEGILLTMFRPDEQISRQIAEYARSQFKKIIFQTAIPSDKLLRESPCFKMPLAFRNIKSTGVLCYLRLASEIMAKNKINV